MKKTLSRIVIAGLLVLTIVLACTHQPQKYYPVIEIEAEAAKLTQSSAGALNLGFLFDSRPTLQNCEALTGNIARVILKNCPQCRVKNIQCNTALDQTQQRLLSDAPLATPSGRMTNGTVVFTSANPEFALAACQATEAQSAAGSNPVKCFTANTPRAKPAAPSVLSHWNLILFFSTFAAAWLAGWLIIKYEHLHAHLSHDNISGGPQKYHTQPTPRIGGLTVVSGLLVAGGVMLLDNVPTEREFGLLLVAGIPAFLGGLIEDLTKQVGVLKRLLLTMLSGAAAAWLLGTVLDRLDIPGVDSALLWLPFAVVFTSFAVGGMANAINIIDGYNGLAGGFTVIVLAAMTYVAALVGDTLVFSTALALAGALLGFLVWNWPCGKIFLGDGGAYLLGFLLAELSILLVARNPEVSPWFPLLLLIYPVFETFFSIYRKKILRGHSPSAPDGLHLHMLIYKRIVPREARNQGPVSKLARNNRVAKYFWANAIITALPAIALWRSSGALIAAVICYCVFYVIAYRKITRWKIKPVRTQINRPMPDSGY